MAEGPPHQNGGRIAGEMNDGVDVREARGDRENQNGRGTDPLSEKGIGQPDTEQGVRDRIHQVTGGVSGEIADTACGSSFRAARRRWAFRPP